MNKRKHHRYSLDGYALDPGQRRLSRNGQTVHLTPRPFQVLLYLIENRDRLVARGELLDRFWQGRDVYDVALTKCIGAIRKALEDRREPPRFVETRYGEGYRYIGPFQRQIVEAEVEPVEIERVRGVRIVIEEEFQAEPEPKASAPAAEIARSAPAARARSGRWALALALCAAALTGAALVFSRGRRAPENSIPSNN